MTSLSSGGGSVARQEVLRADHAHRYHTIVPITSHFPVFDTHHTQNTSGIRDLSTKYK